MQKTQQNQGFSAFFGFRASLLISIQDFFRFFVLSRKRLKENSKAEKENQTEREWTKHKKEFLIQSRKKNGIGGLC